MRKLYTSQFLFPFLFMALLSALLHWRVFHYEIGGIHAWRQTQTQQTTLNFYRYDPNILNSRSNIIDKNKEPTIQRNEFPVLQWTMGMMYHITGDSIVVTRLFMFLLGLCTLAGVYYWIRQWWDKTFVALAAAWAFSFSPVFFYYSMNTLPDLLALSATVWSLALFFNFIRSGSKFSMIGSAFFISLAIAAKLPYIVFLGAHGSWWLWSVFRKRFRHIRTEITFAIVHLLLIAPSVWWYAWVIPTWHNDVVTGIWLKHLPWHEIQAIMRYHYKVMFPSLLLGYIAIVFLCVGVAFIFIRRVWQDNRFWWLFFMGISVLSYWIFEFTTIGVVHDYYMIPFLPVLYGLVAYGIKRSMEMSVWIRRGAIALLLIMPVLTYYITRDFWSVKYNPQLQDAFLYYKDLRNAAPSGSICVMLNDGSGYIFSYLVDKQGWEADNDQLPAPWLDDMITNYGATYLYSNSRTYESNPEVIPYLEKLVMERGNIRVFQLRQVK